MRVRKKAEIEKHRLIKNKPHAGGMLDRAEGREETLVEGQHCS